MAFDEKLAGRIRTYLAVRQPVTEKKMFGGVAFMLSGKMCCGVLNGDLVARVSAEDYAAALRKPHARPMDFTGRVLKGFVYVAPAATRTSRALSAWLDPSIAFVNAPTEKPTRKKRRSDSRHAK